MERENVACGLRSEQQQGAAGGSRESDMKTAGHVTVTHPPVCTCREGEEGAGTVCPEECLSYPARGGEVSVSRTGYYGVC